MKQILRATAIICVLLLLGLGAVMPRLASRFLDHQLESERIRLENQSFSLQLVQEVDFFQTLALLRGTNTQVELSEGYRMTEAEVTAAVLVAIAELYAVGIAHGIPDVTPILLTSRDTPGLSGVFWYCEWRDEDQMKEFMWLDDQSGQVVAFRLRVEQANLATDGENFPVTVWIAAEYCLTHYPIDTTDLSHAVAYAEGNTSADSVDGAESTGNYTITLFREREGLEERCLIPVILLDNWLSFNL